MTGQRHPAAVPRVTLSLPCHRPEQRRRVWVGADGSRSNKSSESTGKCGPGRVASVLRVASHYHPKSGFSSGRWIWEVVQRLLVLPGSRACDALSVTHSSSLVSAGGRSPIPSTVTPAGRSLAGIRRWTAGPVLYRLAGWPVGHSNTDARKLPPTQAPAPVAQHPGLQHDNRLHYASLVADSERRAGLGWESQSSSVVRGALASCH